MLVMSALSNKEMVTENVFLAHLNEVLEKYDKYYPPELQLLTIRGLYAYLIRNFEFIKWSVSWEIFAMTNYQASDSKGVRKRYSVDCNELYHIGRLIH